MMRTRAALALRTLFVLLLVGGTYAFAMFQGGMASWTIFYFLLPFAGYSLCILLYPVRRITVIRSISKPLASIGEPVSVTLSVKRPDRFPLLYLLVRDQEEGQAVAAGADRRSAKLFIPGFKKEFDLAYELAGTRRGEHVFPPVQLEAADFFGWLRKKASVEAEGAGSFLVFPETTAVNYVPIGSNQERGAADSPFAFNRETNVATSVRDYQPGDRVSWIHWKSFARTQNLMTKEFDSKRGEHAVLLLDVRPSDTFEEQVRFAASVVKEAAARRADLAFATTDAAHAVIRAVADDGGLRHALTQLARLQPLDTAELRPPNYASALQGTGAVVVVSGSPDASLLRPILAAASMQPVYCFVIRKTEGPLPESVSEQMKTAKSLGVRVQLLSADQFERSFQGVGQP